MDPGLRRDDGLLSMTGWWDDCLLGDVLLG
jgi:hypothetical protein